MKNEKNIQLKQKIAELEDELAEREASLPVHSARAHQLQAIEELEDEINSKKAELKILEG
jgi:hypothetical protein